MTDDRRRPAGAGGVERLPSGKWRVRVTTNDGRRKTLGVYATEGLAREVLDAHLIQAASAGTAPTGAITLRTFGEKYLDARELSGVRGISIDRDRWAAHIATAFFADWPIADISTRDVRRWRDELAKKKATLPKKGGGRREIDRKLSRGSIKHAVNLLRVALDAAVEDDLIPANPALGVRVAKEQRTEEPWTYLTLEEQRAILTCESIPEPERLIIAFAIGTGLRKGEQWSLKLSDLHVAGEHPEVVVRFGSPGKPTKSGKPRWVPLLGVALDAAKRWLELLPTYAKLNPIGLVFPTRRGYCRDGRPFRAIVAGRPSMRWPEMLRLAGITRRVRWHDLRHTCASSLLAGWFGRRWTLEEVKGMLGHSTITVTERYAHLAPSALRQAATETRNSRPSQVHAPTEADRV